MNIDARQEAKPQSLEAPVARSSFYLAMRILGREQRDAMFAIYGFCRAADDIADDGGPKTERLAMLDRWRADLAKLYAGGPPTELTRFLAVPVERFGLREQDFLAILDGMEMDIRDNIQAPDVWTLDLYCDRVASAVGRLSVRVFGVAEPMGEQLSHHLGRALQMTNILRDLDEDAKLGRLYLPRQALAAAGIDQSEILKVLDHPHLGRACSTIVDSARGHYDAASSVMARCCRNVVRSPRVMASVYRGLLERLAARGWTPPRARMKPSKLQFAWAVMRYGIV